MAMSQNRYQFLGAMGEGSTALFYRAYDLVLDREVVFKVILSGRFKPNTQDQFSREARALARLDNPHLVKIYEAGAYQEMETYYLVMEHVKGQKMSHSLDLPRALDYLLQALHAIHQAHEQGLVHCDLRPDNLIVTANGKVKLIGFGLGLPSRNCDGALAYLAPEQARGSDPVDRRADVYAMGVILFELTTGHLPFHGDNPSDQVAKLLHNTPPRLVDFNPQALACLEPIVGRALALSPAERYATALEMARAIEQMRQNPSR